MKTMLRLMREVEMAGNSPHAGGLPGDKSACTHVHQAREAQPPCAPTSTVLHMSLQSVASQVHAQHQQIRLLEDQVIRLNSALAIQSSHAHAMERRLEQWFALLEEAAPPHRPRGQPTPLGFNPLPEEAGSLAAPHHVRQGQPTQLPPAAAVPLVRFSSDGSVFTAFSASPRMEPAGAGVPAHQRNSAPVLMPAAGNPPSSAEGAEAAVWSAQSSGGFTPLVGPMRMAPTAAQMQPFFFGAGEAPWSPTAQLPKGCGLPYMMPQQHMAMQMQQMSQMWSQPGPMQTSSLMPAGQTHFSQPLMGQLQHMHMSQQQCMVPMSPMMYCRPQMPGQPLPPAGGSLGVSPVAVLPNPLKRRSPMEAHRSPLATDGSGARPQSPGRQGAGMR